MRSGVVLKLLIESSQEPLVFCFDGRLRPYRALAVACHERAIRSQTPCKMSMPHTTDWDGAATSLLLFYRTVFGSRKRGVCNYK